MISHKYFFVYLLILPGFCMARQHKTNMVAKLDMIAPIDDFTFPTLQAGVEQKISRRFSVEATFGYQLYDFNDRTDSSFIDPSGFKASLSIRYYIIRVGKQELCGLYTALNPFYRENKFNSFITYTDGPTDVTDYFSGKKICRGINILTGFQKNMGRRIYMDTYIGVGPMEREITNNNREYDRSKGHVIFAMNKHFGNYQNEMKLSDENGTTVNVTFGFKLGIRLF
jgi:hypothetical protein